MFFFHCIFIESKVIEELMIKNCNNYFINIRSSLIVNVYRINLHMLQLVYSTRIRTYVLVNFTSKSRILDLKIIFKMINILYGVILPFSVVLCVYYYCFS